MNDYGLKLRQERRAELAQRALPAGTLNEYGETFAVSKTEAGASFPAAAYAYVPDANMPSTWKLRLWATPTGGPDAGIVGAAIAALGKGFRGNKVQIPAADLAAVKAKVKAAWIKANPDKDPKKDMPTFSAGEAVAAALEDADLVACGDMMDHGGDEPIDGDDDFLEAILHHHDEILDLLDEYNPVDPDVVDFAAKTDKAVRQASSDIYGLLGKLILTDGAGEQQTQAGPDVQDSPVPAMYGYSIESEEFGTLPPALAAAVVKNLQKQLAKETDPAKKAEIQAKIDKFTK